MKFFVSGDSGNSLFMSYNGKYYATGIMSGSLLNNDFICDVSRPQIYTDISKFYNWIIETVEKT